MELKFSAVILQNKDMDAAYVEVEGGTAVSYGSKGCAACSPARGGGTDFMEHADLLEGA